MLAAITAGDKVALMKAIRRPVNFIQIGAHGPSSRRLWSRTVQFPPSLDYQGGCHRSLPPKSPVGICARSLSPSAQKHSKMSLLGISSSVKLIVTGFVRIFG